jgi:hypothetical protein
MKALAVLGITIGIGGSLFFVLSGWKPNHTGTPLRVNWIIPAGFHGALKIKSPSRKTGFFDPEEITLVVPPDGQVRDPQGGRLLGEQFWQLGWCKFTDGMTLPRDFGGTAPSIIAFRAVQDDAAPTVAFVGSLKEKNRVLGIPDMEVVHARGQGAATID